MTAIGVFSFFGAVMASLAGTTLIWPGTLLDHMWAVNAPAYRQLTSFGETVGVPFLALSAALAAAGLGGLDADSGGGGSPWSSSQRKL
jgi:hypothetical protein